MLNNREEEREREKERDRTQIRYIFSTKVFQYKMFKKFYTKLKLG